MEEIREELIKYIEYLSEKDDVYYGFDNIEESVDEYLKQKNN